MSVEWQLEQLHTDHIDFGFIILEQEDSHFYRWGRMSLQAVERSSGILSIKNTGLIEYRQCAVYVKRTCGATRGAEIFCFSSILLSGRQIKNCRIFFHSAEICLFTGSTSRISLYDIVVVIQHHKIGIIACAYFSFPIIYAKSSCRI